MEIQIRVSLLLSIVILCGLANAQTEENYGISSGFQIIDRYAIYDFYSMLTSQNIYDRRKAYMEFSDLLGGKSIIKNYNNEKDSVNKSIITIIGYQLYPDSPIWKTRIIQFFRKPENEINRIWGECSKYGDYGCEFIPYLDALGEISYTNETAFNILCQLPSDAAVSEYKSEVICRVANKSPRYFLRQLKKFSKKDRFSPLSDIAFSLDEYNCSFIQECQKLVDKKDPELSNIALFSMRYVKKYFDDINKKD